MNLHFYLPASEIEKKVNELYDGTLYEGKVGDFGAWARVDKRERITVECTGDRVITHVPLRIKAKLKWKEALLGSLDILTPKVEQTEFDITAHFSTKIEALPDWTIRAETQGNFFWDHKPKVGVGLLKVNVTAVLQPKIMGEIVKASQAIDSFLVSGVNLREKVLAGWNFFRDPLEIYSPPPVFGLALFRSGTPVATPIRCDDDVLSCRVSIPAELKVVVKNDFSHSQSSLMPTFPPVATLPDHFEEKVVSEIDYSTLCLTYGEDEFQIGNIDIRIKGMGIKCKNKQLNTSFSLLIGYAIGPLRRSSRAIAFVSCEPVVDEEGKVIVSMLDLEILTGDPFIRGYLRLRKKKVVRFLHKEAQSLVNSIDAVVEKEIRSHLESFRIHSNLITEGRLEGCFHENIHLLPTCISLTSRVKGKAHIKIERL